MRIETSSHFTGLRSDPLTQEYTSMAPTALWGPLTCHVLGEEAHAVGFEGMLIANWLQVAMLIMRILGADVTASNSHQARCQAINIVLVIGQAQAGAHHPWQFDR